MNKIITKILIAIVLSSIIVGVSIGFLSVLHASKALQQEAYDKLHYVSNNYANEFSTMLKKVEGHVDILEAVVASSFDTKQFVGNNSYRSEYMKQLNDILKRAGENNLGIQGIYTIINPELTGKVYESWFINDRKGNFIYQEPEDISVFSPTNKNMAWYYEPISNEEGVWLPPYVDATINVKMISFTKAIFNDGQLIGVAGIDIAFKDIEKTIDNMKLYESGYSFLLNSDYTVLLHPSLESGTYIPNLENENLSNVIESMENNKSDVIEYVYENNIKIMGFSKLSNGWILGASIIASEILTPVERLKDSIKVSVAFMLIITAIVGLFISKSITAPINRLGDIAALISKGQHDVELDLNSNNEIGKLSKSFHIMTKKLISSHEELKENEKKYRTLFESSTDAISIIDMDTGRFIDCNSSSIKLHDTETRKMFLGLEPSKLSPKYQPSGQLSKNLSFELIKTAYKEGGKEFEWTHCKRDGTLFPVMVTLSPMVLGEKKYMIAFGKDITDRKNKEKERENLIKELKDAFENIKTLNGLIPICANCKKIRDDKGYWNNLEAYIEKYSDASFSHSMCIECSDELYGNEDWYINMKEKEKK